MTDLEQAKQWYRDLNAYYVTEVTGGYLDVTTDEIPGYFIVASVDYDGEPSLEIYTDAQLIELWLNERDEDSDEFRLWVRERDEEDDE